jgi:Cof subfamily protein (haloacid dehalogenase superfamily)
MNSFKAIAIDLDGTLLTSGECITKDTSKLLSKLNDSGISIILASGRSVELQICFASFLPPIFHIVAFNGGIAAEFKDGTYSIHHKSSMDSRTVLQIVNVFQNFGISFMIYVGETCCIPSTSLADAMRREGILNVRECSDLSFLTSSSDILKIAIPLGRIDPAETERAAVECSLRDMDMPSLGLKLLHMEDWIDIVPATSGKAAGLRVVCNRLGLDMSDVLAFGDGGNDLCMLAAAGCSIAPANANAAAKRAAARVSPWSNDEECVRRELERLRPSIADPDPMSVQAA